MLWKLRPVDSHCAKFVPNPTFQLSEKKKGLANFAKPLISLDLIGSSTWARTRDLRINSPALYQLSYRGIQPQIIASIFGFFETEPARIKFMRVSSAANVGSATIETCLLLSTDLPNETRPNAIRFVLVVATLRA